MGFKSDGIRWKWDDKTTTPCSNWRNTTTNTDEPVEIKAPEWKIGDKVELNSPVSNAPMQYGWVCPKCGRVNSPWTSTCWCWSLGPGGVPIIKC